MQFDFDKFKIVSPKRTRGELTGWEGFFPYYAGYPEVFAHELLQSADLPKSSRVLDPWNGSGTTTFAASKLMLNAIGVDINPVMAIVARARTLPPSEADSLASLSRELLAKAARDKISIADDPLENWFGPLTSNWIRSLERSITSSLVSNHTQATGEIHAISALAATYYVALFALCRELASKFQTSNPTWLKVPLQGQRRASSDRCKMADRFATLVENMAMALTPRNAKAADAPMVELLVADTAGSLNLRGKFDFVLTSPPYCTRIDYTAATRLQLAVLAPMLTIGKAELSQRMLGSIRVPTREIMPNPQWGATCNAFLNAVKDHPSKASSGYYYKTHVDYFEKMHRSLGNITSAMKAKGAAVLVVQDSYYKEVRNDLPLIITEMAAAHGLRLRRRQDFHLSKTLAGSHPHSKYYRKSFGAVEAVLCFENSWSR
jgi:DNA methylase